jgi:MFS transporter, DHA2 family, multidrug resistance protein
MTDEAAEDGFEQASDVADAGEAVGARATPPFKTVPYHGIITVSVMMATIMQSLDSTIANVALPRMQGTLSATQDQMGWVLTSYIVAAAITIPLTGWLAGEFGRRKVFLVSIFLFTLASALCGLAQSLPQIVLFRFLQGVGGAALVPLSQAVLFDINPPKNFGRAMSIWGVGVTLGPVLGPALGGWLTEDYNWRWVFYINLPIGALAFAGLFFTLPESRNAKSSRFDFLGFSSLAVSIAALQVMLDRGQLLDWFSSNEIIVETIVAGISFYIFLVHTFSESKPFINPALFKDRNFVAANVFIFLVGVILFATLALLPPLLQNQLQYPVILTGLVTAPRGFGMLLGMMLVGRLLTYVDTRYIMAVGLALTAYSLWQMTQFSLLMYTWPVLMSGVTQGLGVGLVYVPLSTVAFTTLPAALRNEGTSFFNLLRNVGSSVGISVVMFLLTQNTQRLHASLAEHITPFNIVRNPAVAAAHVQTNTIQGLAGLDAMVTNQATLIGYIDDFQLMMLLTLATIPLLLLIKRVKASASEHPVVME